MLKYCRDYLLPLTLVLLEIIVFGVDARMYHTAILLHEIASIIAMSGVNMFKTVYIAGECAVMILYEGYQLSGTFFSGLLVGISIMLLAFDQYIEYKHIMVKHAENFVGKLFSSIIPRIEDKNFSAQPYNESSSEEESSEIDQNQI